MKTICKNCGYYDAYYKQWSDHYGRMTNGFCSKKKEPQSEFNTCESHKSKEEREKRRHERLLVTLERAVESINEIAQILKEKEEDKGGE